MLKGIAASPGIVIGRAYVYSEKEIPYNENILDEGDVPAEIQRLNRAISMSKEQLSAIIAELNDKDESEKAEIINVHLMMLEDESFVSEMREKISGELRYAETAARDIGKKYSEMFEKMEDEYMRERSADIKDIARRLALNLLDMPIKSVNDIRTESIIVAVDISPADIALLDTSVIKAFCTEIGGVTSHTAIIARMLGIPAVVGIGGFLHSVKDGDMLIIDGINGKVFIDPAEAVIAEYKNKEKEYLEFQNDLKSLKDLPAETKCGKKRITLAANIGSAEDCDIALNSGAEGVGLFRTEFLYMNRSSLPSEEEQFKIYKEVAEKMNPEPVIIRTLDVGGDKSLEAINIPPENNPFLGWRAIRICLAEPDIFKTQIRAILRASSYGYIRVMYPMISGITELKEANRIVEECKKELTEEGIEYNTEIEIGIMVEIPSAAIAADILVEEVDFFSIGTNDLIQYTLAVDRMNERVSHLYQPLHPALLRLIKNVIDVSHKAAKWTGMCGEMAGDAQVAAILVGLGLDELSMSASSIPLVKKAIRDISYRDTQKIFEDALLLDSAEGIEALLAERGSRESENKNE